MAVFVDLDPETENHLGLCGIDMRVSGGVTVRKGVNAPKRVCTAESGEEEKKILRRSWDRLKKRTVRMKRMKDGEKEKKRKREREREREREIEGRDVGGKERP